MSVYHAITEVDYTSNLLLTISRFPALFPHYIQTHPKETNIIIFKKLVHLLFRYVTVIPLLSLFNHSFNSFIIFTSMEIVYLRPGSFNLFCFGEGYKFSHILRMFCV